MPKAQTPKAQISKAQISKAQILEAQIPKAQIPKAHILEAQIPKTQIPRAHIKPKKKRLDILTLFHLYCPHHKIFLFLCKVLSTWHRQGAFIKLAPEKILLYRMIYIF